MTSSKSLALFLVIIASVSCYSVNTTCVVQLAKLAVDIRKLAVSVQEGAIVHVVKYTKLVAEQVKRVKAACDEQESPEIQYFDQIDQTTQFIQLLQEIHVAVSKPDIKLCLNHSSTFLQHSQTIRDKITAGQDFLEHEFIDSVFDLIHEVDPLLKTCGLDGLNDRWNNVMPNSCINKLDTLVNDGSTLRDAQGKPVLIAETLLRLRKDYIQAKGQCPFLDQ